MSTWLHVSPFLSATLHGCQFTHGYSWTCALCMMLDFSLELEEGNISCQFCVSCTGSLSRDVSTSNWHALSSRRCPARHLRTWPTTYTWSQKVLDAGFARPPTDRALFHAHTTHLAIGALLLSGHVSGTATQHTCATKTLLITYNSFRRELKKTYWV